MIANEEPILFNLGECVSPLHILHIVFTEILVLSKKILMNKKIKILRTVQKTDGNYYKYPKLVDIINISKYL